MNNKDKLQNKLSQAEEAEKREDFFSAAFFCRDTLLILYFYLVLFGRIGAKSE